MSRAEFSKPTKRLALQRSGKRCEATGVLYGLPEGQRCNADLSLGVQFDHIILEANSHDNGLENCLAVCPSCHRWKTAKHDTPLAAKTLRQQDKDNGIRSKPRRSLRDDKYLKKLNGDVVDRVTGERVG